MLPICRLNKDNASRALAAGSGRLRYAPSASHNPGKERFSSCAGVTVAGTFQAPQLPEKKKKLIKRSENIASFILIYNNAMHVKLMQNVHMPMLPKIDLYF